MAGFWWLAISPLYRDSKAALSASLTRMVIRSVFNPNVSGTVLALANQLDGKILANNLQIR